MTGAEPAWLVVCHDESGRRLAVVRRGVPFRADRDGAVRMRERMASRARRLGRAVTYTAEPEPDRLRWMVGAYFVP